MVVIMTQAYILMCQQKIWTNTEKNETNMKPFIAELRWFGMSKSKKRITSNVETKLKLNERWGNYVAEHIFYRLIKFPGCSVDKLQTTIWPMRCLTRWWCVWHEQTSNIYNTTFTWVLLHEKEPFFSADFHHLPIHYMHRCHLAKSAKITSEEKNH